MRLWRLIPVLAAMLTWTAAANEGPLIDGLEQLGFQNPKEKGRAELVDGKTGKGVKFTFDDGCKNAFCMSRIRGKPEWDAAAGFSFWVKGDGSKHLGCLQFVWNEDYAVRYDFAFPISGTDWQKITVAWRDLVPVTSNANAKPLDAKTGNAPSKLGGLWVGKWWYWRDVAAHSFTLDDLRLEPTLPPEPDHKPTGAPLQRVLDKLKAGQPVTIVTMGDSLTDFNHWANKPVNWPTLLQAALKAQYKSEVTLINPAIGGTELRQNVNMLGNWLQAAPAPDLVTICFGGNDYNSGMRGAMMEQSMADAVDRVRRATGGKADVLVLTTAPGLERWETYLELVEGCRAAAKAKHAGLADIHAAFHAAGKTDAERVKLFCNDKVHLGPAGHEVFAQTVVKAISAGGQ